VLENRLLVAMVASCITPEAEARSSLYGASWLK
jgi:hypothetical protein